MDPSVHIKDQEKVETVDFNLANVLQSRQNGYRFLGFTMCDLHRLSGEWPTDHRALLCRIIGPIRTRIAEKRHHLAK